MDKTVTKTEKGRPRTCKGFSGSMMGCPLRKPNRQWCDRGIRSASLSQSTTDDPTTFLSALVGHNFNYRRGWWPVYPEVYGLLLVKKYPIHTPKNHQQSSRNRKADARDTRPSRRRSEAQKGGGMENEGGGEGTGERAGGSARRRSVWSGGKQTFLDRRDQDEASTEQGWRVPPLVDG